MVDVPDVELDPLLPGDAGAALDLGPAGDPGQHLVAAALARGVVADLGGDGRARADDRHLATEDVDQVGHLVERGAAEEAAGAGDRGIVAGDDHADADRVGALDHRPQLQHLELGAAEADAALPVEDRAAAAELDRDGCSSEERCKQDQGYRRNQDVEDSWHRYRWRRWPSRSRTQGAWRAPHTSD